MTHIASRAAITDPLFRPLAEVVMDRMAALKVPGVAVGLIAEGQEFMAGFGVTHIHHPLPVDADTLFQIGSTSKTVTATVIMMLTEQGRLDLNTPVRTYLPDLRLQDDSAAAHVTLKHLLTHTGGWLGDYFAHTGLGDDALARYVAQMADLPQLTPLGTMWSYNNAAFALAGRVIEVVTGQPYETAVQTMLFDPLGMDHSVFFAEDAIVQRTAVGHFVVGDETTIARPWALARSAHAVGGVSSSARDQMKYARFHLGDGTAPNGARLLSAEGLAFMQQPWSMGSDMADAMGVAWMLRTVNGVRLVGHGGQTNGQLSAFTFAPDQGFALTVLTNANVGGQLHTEVVEWAYQRYLGLPPEAEPGLDLSEAELAQYAGLYQARLSHHEISVRDGGLVLQVIPQGGFPDKTSPPAPKPKPVQLALLSDERVIGLEPPFKGARGRFFRDADGEIEWFRFGGRIARRA